jgi:hypothetical protein
MGDDDDGKTGPLRQATKEASQSLDPASRGTDADDGPSVGGAHGDLEFGLVAVRL